MSFCTKILTIAIMCSFIHDTCPHSISPFQYTIQLYYKSFHCLVFQNIFSLLTKSHNPSQNASLRSFLKFSKAFPHPSVSLEKSSWFSSIGFRFFFHYIMCEVSSHVHHNEGSNASFPRMVSSGCSRTFSILTTSLSAALVHSNMADVNNYYSSSNHTCCPSSFSLRYSKT